MNTKWKIGLGAAALLIGLPVGLSMVGALNSVATAPSRVINRTMQTDNIIGNYETFFDRSAQYDARLSQINETASVLRDEQDPAEKIRLRTELGAQRMSCRDLAVKYNADAAKLNRGIFKSNSLPETLSETDCNA